MTSLNNLDLALAFRDISTIEMELKKGKSLKSLYNSEPQKRLSRQARIFYELGGNDLPDFNIERALFDHVHNIGFSIVYSYDMGEDYGVDKTLKYISEFKKFYSRY